MRTEKAIRQMIRAIESDDVIQEGTVTVEENVVVALLQVRLEAMHEALRWAVGEKKGLYTRI